MRQTLTDAIPMFAEAVLDMNAEWVNGRKVPFNISTTEKGFRLAGLENWSAGVYFLQAQLSTEIRTVKLIK